MNRYSLLRITLITMVSSMLLTACISSRNKKRGCASTSSSMGAERVLAGEKPDKKQKYKVKGMN